MPSQLINQTLSNLAGGVTQQYQEGRYDSQVSEMVNCIPSLTRGVMRRNPTQFPGQYAFNFNAEVTDSFIYFYDRGTTDEKYMVAIPGNGNILVFKIGDSLSQTVTINSAAYLQCTGKARDVFKAITVGDYTFIINTEKEVAMDSNTYNDDNPTYQGDYDKKAFYWIKKTASVVTDSKQQTSGDTVTTGSKTVGYKYTLNGQTVEGGVESRPGETAYDFSTADRIVEELETLLEPTVPLIPDAYQYTADSAFLYSFILTDTITTWDWEDTFANEASLGVWKTVPDSSDLPARLPSALNNFIVKVIGGTTTELDDYFLRYDATTESWKECISPEGVQYKLDASTMPHVLVRFSDGTFGFDQYKELNSTQTAFTTTSMWNEREVGDEDTIPNPSFIGQTLNDIFFYKNRLGVLTNESVILSSTANYGNFFSQTVQNILDDDPIDLTVATEQVTILKDTATSATALIIFAEDTQFTLKSVDEGPITPTSSTLTIMSKYDFNDSVSSLSMGNKIYFTSVSGNYSQLHNYDASSLGFQQVQANLLTAHLPSYLPNDIYKMVGHTTLGYLFLVDDTTRNEIIVLNNTFLGGQDVQNAFHKWTFRYDILSIGILDNQLVIVFEQPSFNECRLCTIDLEVPGTIDDVVYGDIFGSNPTAYNTYESYIEFSKFYNRDNTGKGSGRPRTQLRTILYTITDNSHYKSLVGNEQYNRIAPANGFIDWDDITTWDDTDVWLDVNPMYITEYENDEKITLMMNNENLYLKFRSSETEPLKGFELATANIEMFEHQRSLRR